ncbi:hypothetical protein GE061_014758 [Apolygus lucorum]|uniref:Uncharacterized protein n=1 Tax=Apolygus lucorum TaxID=248454 RepID=A0A8S9XN55_APOLU|nr:hypothetical protein GE061_014758 [Apolygus lucorum]
MNIRRWRGGGVGRGTRDSCSTPLGRSSEGRHLRPNRCHNSQHVTPTNLPEEHLSGGAGQAAAKTVVSGRKT